MLLGHWDSSKIRRSQRCDENQLCQQLALPPPWKTLAYLVSQAVMLRSESVNISLRPPKSTSPGLGKSASTQVKEWLLTMTSNSVPQSGPALQLQLQLGQQEAPKRETVIGDLRQPRLCNAAIYSLSLCVQNYFHSWVLTTVDVDLRSSRQGMPCSPPEPLF